MKVVIYEYEKIERVAGLLNLLVNMPQEKGIDRCRAIAEIGDILDSGKIKDREEQKGGER